MFQIPQRHRLAAAAIVLSALAACSGGSQELIGKWQTSEASGAMVWEFTGNGAIVQGPIRGRYSLGDNHRIKIETPQATSIYQMELAGDRLALTDSHGSKLTFTKVKNVL